MFGFNECKTCVLALETLIDYFQEQELDAMALKFKKTLINLF